MARDAHNATWRALRRFVDVLDANVATELTADAPAGLNVTAPASEAYYILPNERAVREHLERNHFAQVYVFPSSERSRRPRTVGASTKSMPANLEITIAVRVSEEAGADAYSETWKTLTPKEREFLRCETLLGAIQDVIDSKARGPSGNGDDIVQVVFVDSRSGDDRFASSSLDGTWGSQRWLVRQIINVPLQTS